MSETGTRIVTIVLPETTEAQRMAIENTVTGYGFEPRFYESPQAAEETIKDTEVLFSMSSKLAAMAENLRWQCSPSAGIDHLRNCEVFKNGQAVLTCSSGAYGVTISEHIIMMILEVLRRQSDYRTIVQAHQWTRNLPVRSIYGSRIVLLGTGDIGQAAAVRLRSFAPASLTGVSRSGSNPGLLFDKAVQVKDLNSVLPDADILILSLPATPETRRIIGKEQLALLPDDALIVNVGRGICIDQKALEEELSARRLYAALDVFETEPIPEGDPFWDCPNLLITPHVAGDSALPYTVEKVVQQFLEDFVRYAEGKPLLHQADVARGY